MQEIDYMEPYQTASLIAKVQDICREKGWSPEETLSACVICGVTYNGKRDLSILDDNVSRQELVNCAGVLDDDFFREAARMRIDVSHRNRSEQKYRREIQPELN